MKHIHILTNDKFINRFIKFINNNFNSEEHLFFVFDGVKESELPTIKEKNIVRYISKGNTFKNKYLKYLLYFIQLPILYWKLFKFTRKAEKIYFHGLFDPREIMFLYLFKKLLQKSYWIIWGGDLYCYNTRKKNPGILKKIYYHIETKVKGNFKGYIPTVFGDYVLVRDWYNAQGKYYECFLYPLTLFEDIKNNLFSKNELYILIGNSADPTNNHIDILNKLEKYKNKNIKLLAPLSYGDKIYAQKVKEKGEKIFGEKFVGITEFMEHTEYLKFLSCIDIGIFAHDRQQGLGNIYRLLGLGKTIYIKDSITTYQWLKNLKLEFKNYYSENILDEISIKEKEKNINIIKNHFSEKHLIQQWKKIFE